MLAGFKSCKRYTLFVGILFFCFKCYALSIQHVSHSPLHLPDLTSEMLVKIRFFLDQPASVSLKIYDDRNVLIRTVNSGAVLEKGDQILSWDVRDEVGKQVPAEAYHYTLVASAGSERVTYDITDLLSSNSGTLYNPVWDREKGTISYLLSKASRVSIRIGIDDGGPLLATVINWLPRKRGQHIEKWDGYAPDQTFNISKLPKAKLHIETFALTENTILIGNNIKKSEYVDASSNKVVRDNHQAKVSMFNHASKIAGDRRDYNLSIVLPDGSIQKNGLAVYSGIIPIRIVAPKEDVHRMLRDRFEPILFVDGEFVSELETGFFPITWKLDTKLLSTGKHYITVNLRGYDGQYGTVSKNIYIDNKD